MKERHTLSNTARSQFVITSLPKRSDFSVGKSNHNQNALIPLLNSSEAEWKLKLSEFNSPIAIDSNASTFSISHTE